jgi:hypothetical protein
MSAPELRAVMRAVLAELDEDARASVVDTLIGRATKASSGWKPTRPSQRMVEEAQSFAEAARHIGHADPDDVTEHLRRATKAFLSGDHASAKAVFEAILPPIASVDIDLGQHELVEEVLGVDARASVAQYVASVYTTTPLRHRTDAILRALEQVEGVGTLLSPIRDMEDVSAGVLPDLAAFLPLWVKRLQRFRPPKDEWETEHERWLREAAFRADGIGGLERIARKTKRPQTYLAWYEALADQGDWTGALKACATGGDPLESFAATEEGHKPRLATPSLVALIRGARSGAALTDAGREPVIDAMRIATEKRTAGILGNSRRRHYGHARVARRVVRRRCAQEPRGRAPEMGDRSPPAVLASHAFREELARACESLGVVPP